MIIACTVACSAANAGDIPMLNRRIKMRFFQDFAGMGIIQCHVPLHDRFPVGKGGIGVIRHKWIAVPVCASIINCTAKRIDPFLFLNCMARARLGAFSAAIA